MTARDTPGMHETPDSTTGLDLQTGPLALKERSGQSPAVLSTTVRSQSGPSPVVLDRRRRVRPVGTSKEGSHRTPDCRTPARTTTPQPKESDMTPNPNHLAEKGHMSKIIGTA